jgi:hypothetical protein
MSTSVAHVYKVGPRKDHRGVDLIFEVLLFDRLWFLRRLSSVENIDDQLHE